MKNLKKENQTEILEIKSPVSQTNHSGTWLQQTRTSRRQNLRARRYNRNERKKTEEILVKQLKSCERNM
jgi:hypothetical protein